MAWALGINLLIFAGLLLFLLKTGSMQWSLTKKLLAGLALGSLFGLALHLVYGENNPILEESINWFNVIGDGYVHLMQMIITPLVFVSILNAVTRLHQVSSLGKISVLTLGALLFTTFIAAGTCVLITNLFGLTAEGLVQGAQETARLTTIKGKYIDQIAHLTGPQLLLSFIPQNPFADLAGAHPTSIISVVIFAAFVGMAVLQLLEDDPGKGQRLLKAIDILQGWVMKLVHLVMKFAPYGILALMTKVVSSSHPQDIIKLGRFVVASYVSIGIMFMVHGILLALVGVNPLKFFRRSWPVIVFAFINRSSAASIPLNVETQIRRLGIPSAIASFSASFGATIGQNGCAGLYPAMLADMTAPIVGINPMDPVWLATLLGIVTISSFGVAGVGGGATFAALIVLSAMGLPVTLIALLISIEPLIDMGRTALNVSGAMTAGTFTSQLLKQTDENVMNCKDDRELVSL